MAPASVKRAMTAVRTFHQFLVMEGLRADDPGSHLELPTVPKAVPKALSEAEVEAILDAVDGTDPVSRRDRAMLEMLYGTGMRISELVGMSLTDLDMSEATVRVLGKGQKERVLPMGRCALEALTAWLVPAGRGEIVAGALGIPARPRSGLAQPAGSAPDSAGRVGCGEEEGSAGGAGCQGLPSRVPPLMRHPHVGFTVPTSGRCRRILGHASISTTQVYTLVSKEKLWEAYRAAHPRAVLDR